MSYVDQTINKLLTLPGERFNLTMTSVMDVVYDSILDSSTDGTFKAVCLSGIKTEDNNGDGKIDEADGEKILGFLTVVVRPLAPFGDIIPDPANKTDAESINGAIALHSAVFKARSDFLAQQSDVPSFGQILNCYFEDGSIKNSEFKSLRFQKFTSKDFDDRYQNLATTEGVVSIIDANWSNSSLLGPPPSAGGSVPDRTPQQAAFETNLAAALKAKGLPFHVTDRTRTVDMQVQRIMNKYRNNGPEEVKSTYGSRGTKMVAAIQKGDQATLRSLASKSSKHLVGNAIDIRTWHYTNEQITIVLEEIRKLGGNPLLENIEDCWTKSGRNVTVTQRLPGAKPGGAGVKKAPCYNEHIHIDIPENYSG